MRCVYPDSPPKVQQVIIAYSADKMKLKMNLDFASQTLREAKSEFILGFRTLREAKSRFILAFRSTQNAKSQFIFGFPDTPKAKS